MKQKFTYLLFLLTFSTLLGIGQDAYAVDFYWRSSGNADQNYTNAANWESAPGSNTPANGALAPTSVDNVYFPAGNATQTINMSTGAAAGNVHVQSAGVITFNGASFAVPLNVYGSFTSNGNHLFTSTFGIVFLGTGNHTINMGDSAIHSVGNGTNNQDFRFEGTGTYTLLSDLNIPGKHIAISNTTFIANEFTIRTKAFVVLSTTSGNKTVNLIRSKLHVSRGISNYGALVFDANPATTSYAFTDAEIYVDQQDSQAFISVRAAGTEINGIKSITFTEATPGIATAHIRIDFRSSTLNVEDFNINVSKFAFSISGQAGAPNSSPININITNLNLLQPVDITAVFALHLSVANINEAVSCVGQSSLRPIGGYPISFNATAPIVTSNIAFQNVVFSNQTLTMPTANDLGQNSGTYTTSAGAVSRSFYWVGGTGNWNDPTKWSIVGSGGAPQTAAGCLPNYNDDVYFDANSFSAAGQVVTVAGGASVVGYVRNIYWTDPSLRGRITGGTLNISGSVDFSGSTGVAPRLVFLGTGNHTVKSGTNFTYASSDINFSGSGTYTLVDNLIANTSTTVLNVFAGTFSSNGKAITTYQFFSESRPLIASNLLNVDISNSVVTLARDGSTLSRVEDGAFYLNSQYLNSFTATGSTINLTGTAVPAMFIVGYDAAATSLSSITFNDINFTANSGSAILFNNGVHNFAANDVSFGSNALISQLAVLNTGSHTVNNYSLTPGKEYTFSTYGAVLWRPRYTVLNAINTNASSSCSPLVTIKSNTAGTVASLHKASGLFTVQNAVIKDIHATGVTLTSVGGQDLGGNTNVTVVAPASQNFYWVGGAGNWNDPSHWSIGVSGGDPALNNVNNCIPSMVDNVFFDGNSFTANNQTVTIDNEAFSRNMFWDPAVNSRTPILAGTSVFNLNTYGAVTLAANMSYTFNGKWNMRGNSLAANDNAITTNGVTVAAELNFSGTGRYDLLDNLNTTNFVNLNTGEFYTNGKNINARAMRLTVTGNNKADISNSVITLFGADNVYTYQAYHSNNLANWNASGSTINANNRHVYIGIPNGVTMDYGTVNMSPTLIGQKITAVNGTLRATDITWSHDLAFPSNTEGNVEVGNLTFVPSSNNIIQAGKTITVTNQLIAAGTPCNFMSISSSAAGSPATLISTLCNFDIKFARFTDITAGGTCTPAQNMVVGDNIGGNSNWTFSSVAAAQYLGADKVLGCNQYPYTLSTDGFNTNATSYLWSTGETTADITVTGPGTYSVTVTYGVGCTLTDQITLSLAPNPVLAVATVNACETAVGSGLGNFNLSDANAMLVTTPANYTFTYHATSADAIAGLNSLTSPYNSNNKTIYVRVVETATGCFSTRDVALVVSTKTTITVSTTNPSACVATDGSFTINGLTVGETYTISYDKDGANQPQVTATATAAGEIEISGLSVGSYTNIRGNSTTACETTIVTANLSYGLAPNTPGAIIAGKPFICLPEATAVSYSITAVPGATTYTWTYSGTGVTFTTGQGTTDVTVTFAAGATSGTLSVTASSACGTSTASTLAVEVSTTPTQPTLTITEPTCIEATATITVSSATAGLTFSMDGVDYSNTTGIFTGITAGSNYSITAKNAGGCISTAVTGTIAAAPTATVLVITNPSAVCASGTVDLTALAVTAGSTPGLTFTYFTDAAGTIALANPNAVAVGNTYFIKGANGSCSDIKPVVVTINTVPAPTVTAGGPTAFCTGGSVVLSSSSATGNQWYKDGAILTGETNQTYTATTAGDYTVIVTTTGCPSAPSAGTAVTVNPTPATPTVTAGGPTTFCTGGNVVLSSSSATGNQWYKDGAILTGETNQTYTAATAGDYTVIVTTTGCPSAVSAATTVTVNPTPATPTVTAGGPTTFCTGGSVILSSSSATGNQWYKDGAILTGETNQTYTANTPGDYTVIVTTTGCPSAASAVTTVTVNLTPAIAIVNTAGATCTSVGTATIGNYVATNTYTFSPAGPTVGAGGIINNLTPGLSYTVMANNGNCNSAVSASFSIEQMLPTPTAPIVTTTAATCTATGTATLSNYVSTQTYTFSPSGPALGASGLISGMVAGTSYTVTTSDGNCSSVASSSFSIGAILPAPVASISYSAAEYQAVGSATVIQTGQAGGTYTASPSGLSINANTGAIDLSTSTPNQSYTVTYSFSNGTCSSTATTIVKINSRPATISYANPAYCAVGRANIVRTGPTTGTYSASPQGLSINASTGEVNLATSKAGLYTITYSYQDGSISASTTTTITVNALPVITLTSDIPSGNTISLGDVVTLTATGGTSYSWTGDDIQSGQNTNVIKVRPRLASTYKVTVTNASGCSETMEFAINIVGDRKITPNNVITPNGDGKNDVWVVKNLDYYPNNTVNIYDRAGRRVYSVKAYKNNWDGTYNGQPLAEGAYVYVIDSGEGIGLLRGTVNIIRDQR